MGRWKVGEDAEEEHTFLNRVVNSTAFSVIIMATIITNSTFIFVEEEFRNSSNDSDPVWNVSDVVFNVIFTMECILKLAELRLQYFLSSWNLFDFTLVVLGLFGMALNFYTGGAGGGGAGSTSVLRIARVFRVLRLIRLARLLKFIQLLREKFFQDEISVEVREHLQKITILTIFMRAHLQAQSNIIMYFGTSAKACSVELARCILQSQISVYQAIFRAVNEEQNLPPRMLMEVRQVRQSRMIAEELEHFILEAHKAGIIGASEATSIVHPLHMYMSKTCQRHIHHCVSQDDEDDEEAMGGKMSLRTDATMGNLVLPDDSIRSPDDDDDAVVPHPDASPMSSPKAQRPKPPDPSDMGILDVRPPTIEDDLLVQSLPPGCIASSGPLG